MTTIVEKWNSIILMKMCGVNYDRKCIVCDCNHTCVLWRNLSGKDHALEKSLIRNTDVFTCWNCGLFVRKEFVLLIKMRGFAAYGVIMHRRFLINYMLLKYLLESEGEAEINGDVKNKITWTYKYTLL